MRFAYYALRELILLDKGKEIFRTQHISASATSAQVKNFVGQISN